MKFILTGKGKGTHSDFTNDNLFRLDAPVVDSGNEVVSWTEVTDKPLEFTPSAHTHPKSEVGLTDVDNTSDIDKPISTATQTVLDAKVDNSRVLTDVPLNAVFTDTDTIYDDTTIQSAVDLNTAKVSNVDHPLVEVAVPLGAVFTDTVYDDTAIQAEVDGKADVVHTHTVSQITDFPTIPTNTSDLTNNSGFITLADVPADNDTIYDDTAIQAEVDNKLEKQANIQGFWRGTQTEYDALTIDANTVYFIEA